MTVVDVHTHMLTREYLDFLTEHGPELDDRQIPVLRIGQKIDPDPRAPVSGRGFDRAPREARVFTRVAAVRSNEQPERFDARSHPLRADYEESPSLR